MEHERVKEYHRRYDGSWPPTKYYIPQTEGWKSIMNKRLAQAAEIDGYDEKYEAFLQVCMSMLTETICLFVLIIRSQLYIVLPISLGVSQTVSSAITSPNFTEVCLTY